MKQITHNFFHCGVDFFLDCIFSLQNLILGPWYFFSSDYVLHTFIIQLYICLFQLIRCLVFFLEWIFRSDTKKKDYIYFFN